MSNLTSSHRFEVGFPEGDITVARFLGPQGRFRVGRQRLPSGYDPGRAFQRHQKSRISDWLENRTAIFERVQPGQSGLPPRSRRASAKQTVEGSVHEAARVA